MKLPDKYCGPKAEFCLKLCLLTSRNAFKVSPVTWNKIIKLQLYKQRSCIHVVSFCYHHNVGSKEERFFDFRGGFFFSLLKYRSC